MRWARSRNMIKKCPEKPQLPRRDRILIYPGIINSFRLISGVNDWKARRIAGGWGAQSDRAIITNNLGNSYLCEFGKMRIWTFSLDS